MFSLPSAFRHRPFPHSSSSTRRLPARSPSDRSPLALVWIAGIGRAPFLATPTCYLFDVATAYLFVGGRSGSWRQIRRQLEATGDDPKKKSPKWIGQRLQHRRAEGQAVVYVPPDHHRPRCQAQDSKSKKTQAQMSLNRFKSAPLMPDGNEALVAHPNTTPAGLHHHPWPGATTTGMNSITTAASATCKFRAPQRASRSRSNA
jgi:hypothetical protein